MEYFNKETGMVNIPLDLFADLALTMERTSDYFNCNDGVLEDMGLEWWYHHKINRRVQYIVDKLKGK